MKNNVAGVNWSRRYRLALSGYLRQKPVASPRRALELGRQAVALGLETLDVARIHEQAVLAQLSKVRSARLRHAWIKRSTKFFSATISPIEKTHLAARQSDLHARRLDVLLRRRTAESSVSTRQLRQGVARRQTAETALRRSARRRAVLLRAAQRLQKRLRKKTHAMLASQEGQRLRTSRQLQDEIAQTLLAVHVRLLTLKNAALVNTARLDKEIVGTQQLVKESARAIRRMALGLGGKRETQ